MAQHKKRSYDMIDLNYDIFTETFNELYDELFDKIFDDVFTNIFEYSKYIKAHKCSDDRLMHDVDNKIKCVNCDDTEIKKCCICKNILDRDYNFKRCKECIDKYKVYKKCTKCKINLEKTYCFRKCTKCLEKQRYYRIRKYHLKKCSDCYRVIPSNSINTKCNKCIRHYNLIKCNRCYNILQPDYKFKICIECRNKMKHTKNERIINKQCVTCNIKLPENYKFKNCEKCLKQKNKSKQKRY